MAFGKTLTSIGTAGASVFATLGVATTAGIGMLVNEARKFEDAFTGVRKTTDATEAEFTALSRGIRDMSLELPASAVEIANVAEVAGQLGVKKDDILDFTRVMIDLGVATNMSSTDAATALARFMNIVGTSPNDVERLGSTVVHLGNNLATTESEIVNMGLRLAGAGRQVGMSEDQILSFAGALSAVGIKAEMGGSAFSRVMLNMNTAVKGGGEHLEGFAKVAGMSASDFAHAFETDAASAIMAFIIGLGGISDSGGDVAAVLGDLELGEIRVRDTLMRAAGASDVFTEALELGSVAWRENVALSEEAEERYRTFTSKLKVLGNKLLYIAQVLGVPFMDAMSKAIDAVTPFVDKLVEMAQTLEENGGKVNKWIVIIGFAIPVLSFLTAGLLALLAVAGVVTTGIAMLAGALGISMTAAIGLVAEIMSIVVAIGAAIVAVGAFAVYLVTHWDEVAQSTRTLVSNVIGYLSELPGKVAEIATNVAESLYNMMPDWVQEYIQEGARLITEKFQWLTTTIQEILNGDFEKIGEIFAMLAPTIVGIIVGGLPGIIIAASQYLPAIAGAILENIDLIVETVEMVVTTFLNGITEYLPKILEAGVQIIQKILEGIVVALPIIIEAAMTILTTVVETLAENLPLVIDAGMEILNAVQKGILAVLPIIVEVATQIIDSLVLVITKLLPVVLETGVEILLMLIDGITSILPELISTAVSLVEMIVSTIIDLLPILIETGIDILLALIDGIVATLPSLINAAIDLVLAVAGAILDNLPMILEAGVQLLLTLISGILKIVPQLLAAVFTIVIQVAAAIIRALPQILQAGVELVWALIKGIGQTAGELLSAGYDLLTDLVVKFAEFVPKMLDKGVELIGALIDGIIGMVGEAGSAVAKVGEGLISSIGGFVGDMFSKGKDLVGGLKDGINSAKDSVVETATKVGSSVAGAFKKFFKIKSPSRLMRNDVGRMIGRGLTEGMSGEISTIQKMAKAVSLAATPDQPKLAGFEVGDMRGYAGKVSAQLRAETSGFNIERDDEASLLGEIRDELRNQKETIVRIEGDNEAIRAYVNERNALDVFMSKF
ncbi:phage tail tape measure protein [Virgibacillus halotolerans]|uniref:phage tail tape measure protein n=1 Tax=Virgibacillus halotolerans TaxID=1071053 RepID=UPI0023BA761F|nr:phage tail tape measure protein [Virgibacillus halotolerans]